MRRYRRYHPRIRTGALLGGALLIVLLGAATGLAQSTIEISSTSNGGDLHEGSYGEIYSTIGEPVANDSTSVGSNEATWTGFWQVVPILPADTSIGSYEERRGGFASESAIVSAAPDPFSTELQVTVSLARVSNVRLLLFDMMGRPVGSLIEGRREPGMIRVFWHPEGLDAGSYMLQLLIDGEARGTRLVHYYR